MSEFNSSVNSKSNTDQDRELLRLTGQIASAYLGNNMLASSQLPEVIQSIHKSLKGLQEQPIEETVEEIKPAVPIKRSVHQDYIICLEDGKKLKMLKRHLRANYDMSPSEYRAKWGLKPDYPMVAPNYAVQRSNFAKKIGLGRSAGRSSR